MAIAIVGTNARAVNSTNTITVTMGQTPTSGDLLIAVIHTVDSSTTRTVSSIADANGKVTWTVQKTSTYAWGFARDIEIWVGVVASGASTTQTITLSDTPNRNGVADITLSLADITQTSGQYTITSTDTHSNKFDWTDVVYIGIERPYGYSGASHFLIDDLYIEGNIVKGAKDGTQIADPKVGCRTLTIKDSIAATDNIGASDISSPLAQVALYELLRHRVRRTTGKVKIPLDKAIDWTTGKYIMAGQLIWLKSDYIWYPLSEGDAQKTKLFRVLSAHYQFQKTGATCELELTDDTTNSQPVSSSQDPYTTIKRTTDPSFWNHRSTGSFMLQGGDWDSDAKPIIHDYFPVKVM